jgi:hypothetical protein
MPKNPMWFRRRKENLREKCPVCNEEFVPLGASMCWKCAQKKGFGED